MANLKSQKLDRLHYRGIRFGGSVGAEGQARRIEIRRLIEEKCEQAKKLPPRKKLMFLMYYDHGHSLKEIGELCGISEGQVSRRLKKIAEEINENENLDERS